MDVSRIAPIILFAYKRNAHVLRVLSALAKNPEASLSELFVYIDGPTDDSQSEAVAQVARTVKGFPWPGKMEVITSKKNKGLKESIIQGCTEVFKNYDKAIILEDDIVCRPGFLQYMNKALDLYADEQKVFGISGYRHPSTSNDLNHSFFLPLGSSWGWATWKDRWNRVSFDADAMLARIKLEDRLEQMNFGGYPYFEMLKAQSLGKVDSWAISLYASMVCEEAYFLYPRASLVENIGFDSSGTHGSFSEFYSDSPIVDSVIIEKRSVQLDQHITDGFEKRLEEHYGKKTMLQRAKDTYFMLKTKIGVRFFGIG